MAGVRSVVLLAVLGIAATGCGGEDPVQAAAETICAGIDAEASDEVAFEEFERAVARERRNGMDEDELRAALDERCGRAVTAISTTRTEPTDEAVDDEPESDEEPAPVPVDLRELDWTDQSWSTGCTESGELEAVSLTPASEAGQLSHSRNPDAISPIVYTVEVDTVVYGDINDDGVEEAVFRSECFFGNHYEYYVEVWTVDSEGDPRQLPPPIAYTKLEGSIDAVEIAEGRLRIHTSEPAPGDEGPHLGGGYPVEVVTDWTYKQEWLSTEVSRRDTTPESTPLPQSEPSGRFTDPQAPHIRDAFRLPSGNIYCGLLDGGDPEFPPFLSCDIRTGLNPIPGDEYCDLDWAGVVLPMQGSAGPDCRGDTWVTGVGPDGFPVLGYGQTWSYEEITCRSSESGLSCENRSGGSFSLARGGWTAR